jgi:hypothetical protein
MVQSKSYPAGSGDKKIMPVTKTEPVIQPVVHHLTG